MHDARRMGRLQAVEHIGHQGHGLVRRAAALLRQVLGQRAAGHIFKNDVGLLALHVGLKHGHDVRMRQAAHMAGLTQPLFQHARSALPLHGRQQLDGHLALQARVVRQPHTGLRPPAQQAPEFKPPYGSGLRSAARQQALGGGERGKIRHRGLRL